LNNRSTSHAMDCFNAYSRYYDLLYRDKDYAAEVDYVDGLLKRYNALGEQILEFGSGTGKHGRLLAERGYNINGIERSAQMVAQAAITDGFTCQQGDIREVQLGRTFDAVLSLFHVISYQVSNADVHAVFARASEHLQSGGLFVFDVWYSPAVYAQRSEVRVKRLTDGDVEITRLAEPVTYPNENRVDVNYTIFVQDTASGACETIIENHPMRHFSLPELDLLASVTGFERVCAEAFLSGDALSEDTWGVCLVLRKL
jgi:SAM-dependent methyltransferase